MRGSIPLPHFVIEFPARPLHPDPLPSHPVCCECSVRRGHLPFTPYFIASGSVRPASKRASEVGIWSSELERRSIWMGKRGQHISKLDLKGRPLALWPPPSPRRTRDGPIIERAHSSCRFHRWLLLRLTTRVAHLDGSHNVMVPLILKPVRH